MGCAVHTVLDDGEAYTTTDLHVHYVRGVNPGKTIVATGSVVHRGRRLATAEGRALMEDADRMNLTREQQAALRRDDDIAAALTDAFGQETGSSDESQRARMEALNGIHSNAAGLRSWLDTRADPAGKDQTDRFPRRPAG